MGFMNKVLGALTSDFQHALNNTGFFTLEQATTIRDVVVNIWSDNGRAFKAYPNDQAWSQASGIPVSLCGVIRAMKNNVPTAEYQLNFVQDINLADKTQRDLWIKTVRQLSEAAIKDKRYELMRFGLTRAQVDAGYDFIYSNKSVSPDIYVPAFVDLVAQGFVFGGDNQYFNITTQPMGIALAAIFKDSVANGTDLDIAIEELRRAGADNTTIQILTGLSWYLDKVFPSVKDYLEFGNVTTNTIIGLHINISNELAPILVANHSDVLRFLGLKEAQTEVLFYYLGYNNKTLPLTKALAETLNMPEQNTAFTGQLLKALTTPQNNFTESTEMLEKFGLTPTQFIVVRGMMFAAAESYLEFTAGMLTNKTVYPEPGWWTYATLGYRNPEVDFLLGDYRPQATVKQIMGYERGYNLVGLPFGKAVADTQLISQQQGLVMQEMVYSYSTGNVKQLANVLGISETTAQLLYLVSQGQFRELHELLFTNSGHQLVLKVDADGVPVADMNATIATILFREMGIDAQNARYYGGASAGEINYEFVGLNDEEARLVQKLAAGQLDIPALSKKGKLTQPQSQSVAGLSGFNNDSVSEIWLQMQLWNNQGISPDDLQARLDSLNGGRLLKETNLTPEQIQFIDIVASVASGSAPISALTNSTMLGLIGLNNEQVQLVQAAVEARDSELKDESRAKLFSAMKLDTAQQAKLGLAIDLKKGSLDVQQLE
jgi:hypothetical protein